MRLQTFFDRFELFVDAPNGGARLRELVLRLAFRGKLVPQLREEGAANLLMEKIESLRKDCNGSNGGPLPFLDADEIPHNIPTTWQWVRLGEIVAYDSSIKVRPHEIPADAWLLELEDIEKDSSRIIQRLKFSDRMSKSNKAKFATGDVLYGKLRPYLNKVVVADEDGYCATEIVTLRGYFGVEPKFLMYALRRPEFINYINEKSYGVKMPRLGRDDARLAAFPLPPFEEQKRIVAKVDELMRLCDELEERQQQKRETRAQLNYATLAPLNKAASLAPEEFEQASARLADNFATLYDSAGTVGKLRSTILQLAVQGKLVSQDLGDDDASGLIEKNHSSKLRLSIETDVKQSEVLPLDGSPPFDAPIGWVWARLSDLGIFLGGGTPSKSNPSFWRGSIPWVSPKDMKSLYIADTRDHISKRAVEESTVRIIRANSLLMVVRGMILAHSFPVALTLADVTINQDMKALIIASPNIAEYLLLACRGLKDVMLNNVVRSSHGTCRLDSKKVENFLIPIPPLAEQKRIVAKVNQLMSLCDELETKLRQAEADSEKLMNAAIQHVLEAFTEAHSSSGLPNAPTYKHSTGA